jgi:hypothetical protein
VDGCTMSGYICSEFLLIVPVVNSKHFSPLGVGLSTVNHLIKYVLQGQYCVLFQL